MRWRVHRHLWWATFLAIFIAAASNIPGTLLGVNQRHIEHRLVESKARSWIALLASYLGNFLVHLLVFKVTAYWFSPLTSNICLLPARFQFQRRHKRAWDRIRYLKGSRALSEIAGCMGCLRFSIFRFELEYGSFLVAGSYKISIHVMNPPLRGL